MYRLALFPLLALAAPAAADERRLALTGFERLRVDGGFDVTVVQGPPAATATGDARALDQVAMRVEGSTLVVNTGLMGNPQRAGTALPAPRITVSVPALSGLHVNGAARVHVVAMRGDRVDIGVNGAGSVDVGTVRAETLGLTLTGTGALAIAGGTAGRVRVIAYGAGSIDAGALTVRDANVRAETSGSVTLGVRYTATIAALGAGPVTIVGSPECKVGGPGAVTCAKIVAR